MNISNKRITIILLVILEFHLFRLRKLYYIVREKIQYLWSKKIINKNKIKYFVHLSLYWDENSYQMTRNKLTIRELKFYKLNTYLFNEHTNTLELGLKQSKFTPYKKVMPRRLFDAGSARGVGCLFKRGKRLESRTFGALVAWCYVIRSHGLKIGSRLMQAMPENVLNFMFKCK